VISQIRSNQKVRVHKREQHVADYLRPIPERPHHPHPWGRRGHRHRRQCQVVCLFHHTKPIRRGAEIRGRRDYRYLIASDLSWRQHRHCPGPDARWLVEVFNSGLEVA